MSFQPVIPLSGYAGWAFLSRTKARQQASFNASPMLEREVAYFKTAIGQITSVKALVEDRRVLKVALGAFGLQDDINNRAFIHKVIQDGVTDRSALAHKLSDKRYLSLARAFEYLLNPSLAPREKNFSYIISAAYRRREFEIAIGTQDNTMRLAMTLQHELPNLAQEYQTNNARWFAVLGNPPLREILQMSLGFPREFARLEVDVQVSRMQTAAKKRYGTADLSELAQPDFLERLTRNFLIMSQLRESAGVMSGSEIALTLLQSSPSSLAKSISI